MNRMIKLAMSAMIVLMFAASALAQDSVFFSYSASSPTATTQPTWHAITGAGASRTVYIWVQTPTSGSDSITPTDTGLTPTTINSVLNDVPNSAAGIDLNIAGTGTMSSFTAASDYNGTFAGGTTDPQTGNNSVTGTDVNGLSRANAWDAVSSYTLGSNLTATAITGLDAVVAPTTYNGTVANTTSFGGNPTNVARGFALTQTASGVTGGATAVVVGTNTDFLLGQVQFSTSAYGSDTLTLSAASATGALVKGTTDLTSAYTYGTLNFTVTHLNGDANGDGFVNLTDLNGVINNFGTSNPGGDAAGDGNPTGLSDLNAVINNFGNGNGQFSAVPEPASLGLLAFGGLALLGGLKIRRRK
jgi:hypothetical protein